LLDPGESFAPERGYRESTLPRRHIKLRQRLSYGESILSLPGRPLVLAIRSLAVVTILLATATTVAFTQDWPTRPLTMVVAYAPGGPADVVGRILAAGMSDVLGQPVIIENVVGAGGMIGAARVARAPPDGYQFLLGAAGILAQNQSLYKHPLYNSVTAFAPIGLIATAPPILVTRKDLPAGNLTEFIAYGRGHQAALQFGSSGAGSGPHVTCVLLNAAIGISAVHIPYRGASPAYQDLLAGRVDYMCDFISTALPQIEARTVKAIATLTRERTPVLPDLATADEQGLAGFDAPGWYALVAPKGISDSVVWRLNKAMSSALESTAVRDRLRQLGNTVVSVSQRTPDFLTKFIPSEIEKWAVPIKESGVTMD
jgi:tripartite-type tricarboxylate transporter receptor subunit TctC